MSAFTFSAASEEKLATVKLDLRRLCHHALSISQIDFGITEGVRSEERQAELVATGFSKTMDSKHRIDTEDGLACAIDFAPYWKGFKLDWPYIYPVANAFMQASKDLHIPCTWGGAWGMDLWSFRNVMDAQEAYLVLRDKRKGDPFFDGFHIELWNPVDAVHPGEPIKV